MQQPKIPDNEEQRLEALHSLNLLDTGNDERLDRVTRMAKRLFQVPIALVSLVDTNRQWFKSCVGLDVPETSRDISFCGHTILGEETFYIPDTLKDSRFADNPLVVDAPNIRFYAGHPLKSASGEKIGTLCIIDSIPREMSPEDLQALQDLANMVEQEIIALQLATLDDLTGISNRRGFIQLANHCLSMSRRHRTPTSLAYFDLNKFKTINDIHGHAEGDRALKCFTTQIKETFRDSDVYARVGGDEFLVLLTNTSQAVAENILSRFSIELKKYIRTQQLPYELSFSYGVVEFNPNEHQSVESVIKSADQAMYKQKALANNPIPTK